MEHHFIVQQSDIRERLDKWLCSKLPNFSRHQVKSLLDDGRVIVNRRRVLIAGWELEEGDEIEVRLPAGFESKLTGSTEDSNIASYSDRSGSPSSQRSIEHAKTLAEQTGVRESLERYFTRQKEQRHLPRLDKTKESKQNKSIIETTKYQQPKDRIRIYYEDRDVIVVEKRAGILSVPSKEKGSEKENLLSEIQAYLKRRHRGSKHSFVAPLHRLDVETSGVMVFALSKDGQKLEQQFKDHSIRREYTAIVIGSVDKESGIIDIPLEKGDFPGGQKVRPATRGQGKKAITEFSVVERYSNASLLKLRVRTGRTHQIRVHLAAKGFPIVGDKLYANQSQIAISKFPHHALHANLLSFRHPSTNKKYIFHSSLPRDIKNLIDYLRTSQ